jgi:hypothetical protein
MNVDAFLSKLAFREVGAILFRMYVRALFVSVIAVGPVSASHHLLVVLVCLIFSGSLSDIILM